MEDLHLLQLGKLKATLIIVVAAAVAVVDVGFAIAARTAAGVDERKCCSTSVDGT